MKKRFKLSLCIHDNGGCHVIKTPASIHRSCVQTDKHRGVCFNVGVIGSMRQSGSCTRISPMADGVNTPLELTWGGGGVLNIYKRQVVNGNEPNQSIRWIWYEIYE